MLTILKLLRVQQWYKNLVIFLPLLFLGKFFDFSVWQGLVLGFFSLSLVSSFGYIVNDLIDKKKDQLHPEKKERPIASGKIKSFWALLIGILVLGSGLYLAYTLSLAFFFVVLALFILSQLYSFFFKNMVFVDILAIAVNFVLRAISGTFILHVIISPWLILCTFFLSLFLSVAKRKADLHFLQEHAVKHRATLLGYTEQITNALLIIATVALLMAYSLYSLLSNYHWLLLSLPFALYTIFRYLSFVYNNDALVRNPEKVFKDLKMDIAIVLWISVVLLVTL